jgi:hypothetical protein
MIGKVGASAATFAVLILGTNWFLLDVPTANAVRQDSRNDTIVLHAYAKWLIDPKHLVLDLWYIGGENSMADVDRVLFQASASMKSYSFDTVTLAFRGRSRFMLDGDYFGELGREYAAGQNPVYLIRTLPEKARNPDGSRSFPEWTGGLLGVVNKQMEDHNRMHQQWYLDDTLEIAVN